MIRPAAVKTDLLVVGAGPAGCAAAITAHRCGLAVIVVDKAKFPRDKTCGDGLTAMALDELAGLGINVSGCASLFEPSYAMFRSPAGRLAKLPLALPSANRKSVASNAAVTTRAELDFSLTQALRSAGITLREGVSVTRVQLQDGAPKDGANRASPVQVQLSDETVVQARHVIAADGVYSRVRKSLNLCAPAYRGEWHAARQYRQVRSASNARHASSEQQLLQNLWVWFEPDLLPGYAWSFPLANGVVNFGFCALRPKASKPKASRSEASKSEASKEASSGKQMAEIWRSLAGRPHIAEVLEQSEPCASMRAWPIPARRVGAMPLSHGPVLFCGDAAALADPLTGEGIGQALKTGRLAAEAIAEHGRNAEHDRNSVHSRNAEHGSGRSRKASLQEIAQQKIAKQYERMVKQAIHTDHQLARLLSSVLAKPAIANFAIRAVDVNSWTRRHFGRWMFEAYPRALLVTPRRWRQLRRSQLPRQ